MASQISAIHGMSVFDLDDLFWDHRADHYGVRAAEEEREQGLAKILERESWLVEGVYNQWVFRSFEAADKIILLTPSVWLRDWRILKRFLKRKAGLVPSKKESLRDLWQLIMWNHGYDSKQLQRARWSIEHLRHKIVECKTVSEVLRALEK